MRNRMDFWGLFLLGAALFIGGCTTADEGPVDMEMTVEGIILEVNAAEGRILVAEDISREKYEEIKGADWPNLADEGISLYFFGYSAADQLKAGDRVKVWIDGGVDESWPAQAGAEKIEVLG
ncbi:DUF3221 domain-containing protein [Bhargavaea cecembensis]|uniref:DUF3221 domain-containing protein n=1 Tax=Bhargavaea cecembensis TaxID=394098 RepID=UPI000694973E|nr:DUF3221 domain-containing protein [Bhargavaea cecembensis]